ncbi:MAG: MBL fold metallo-hydrolase [Desulfovibrio sp.]|jgi:glyoxylase-like metal-dependent hydrolase (beta-lactamase superfamily II)|nr:MBL fold metallo-hydrolase [Desulfovibrio sp.]
MPSRRLPTLVVSLCLLALSAILTSNAMAASIMQMHPFGDATVYCLSDAQSDRDMSVFPDADPEALKKYVPTGRTPSAILAFLVVRGKDVVLVDSGFGRPGSTLLAALKETGIAPKAVTLVLLTHMHRDHIGGLTNGGERVFPNANILVSAPELKFWTDPATLESRPALRENVDMVGAMLAAYGDKVNTFTFEDTLGPDIAALDAVGHTPGHTAFLLVAGDRQMLFVGDLLHAAALQFPRPDINATYDMDRNKAAEARMKYLGMAADKGIPIAGDHFPFPGVGMVRRVGEGFAFVPGLPAN